MSGSSTPSRRPTRAATESARRWLATTSQPMGQVEPGTCRAGPEDQMCFGVKGDVTEPPPFPVVPLPVDRIEQVCTSVTVTPLP